jgi:type I restriction enzyme S subunit
MTDWPRYTVAHLSSAGVLRVEDGNHGEYRPRSSEFVENGVAYIRAADMSARGIDFHNSSKISDVAVQRITKGVGKPRDVLLSHKGTVGKVALAPDHSPPFVCSPQTTFWRSLDANTLLPSYLAYYMRSQDFVRQLDSRKGETDMAAYVSLTEQRKLTILVPPIGMQHGISTTLGSMDDKIESNRRQAILIGALFAAEFLALTTNSCQTRTKLDSVATFTKGVSYRSAELTSTGDTSLVTLKSVGRHGGYQSSGLKPYIGHPKPEQVLQPRELVVAQTDLTQAADVIGRVVRVPADVSAGRLVASLDLVIVRPREPMPLEFLYGVLLEERFREHCRSRSSGTTVLHLSRDALPQYQAPAVALEDQQRFAALTRPLLDKQDALGRESIRLAALRDALLPELLSGRIRVPEAGEAVDSALA